METSPAGTRKVVVATSLTEASDQVVAAAYQVAQASGAALHVFHAFPLPMAYYGPPLGVGIGHGDIQTLETERDFRKVRVEEQLRRIGLDEEEWPGITVEVGVAHRMLVACAEEVGGDLLVVGAREHRGLLNLGSTADRVLRRATCPVLVVKDGFTASPRRLLAPVDLSDLSEVSLRRGLEVLASWKIDPEAEVDALLVVDLPDFYDQSEISPEEIERLGTEHLKEFLARFEGQSHWSLRPRTRQGFPRQEILEAADEGSTELIILGTHGRGGFERLLLGSVAADIIRGAHASLLVVPPVVTEANDEKQRVALSEALGPTAALLPNR